MTIISLFRPHTKTELFFFHTVASTVHCKFCTFSSVFSFHTITARPPTDRPNDRPTERTTDRPTVRPSVCLRHTPIANHHHTPPHTLSPSSFARSLARSLYADIHCHSSARTRCFPACPCSARRSSFALAPPPSLQSLLPPRAQSVRVRKARAREKKINQKSMHARAYVEYVQDIMLYNTHRYITYLRRWYICRYVSTFICIYCIDL